MMHSYSEIVLTLKLFFTITHMQSCLSPGIPSCGVTFLWCLGIISFFLLTTEEQLWVTAMDLFAAGSETTATTLAWAILYMILNPEAQEKVQKEIDQVVGRDREPSLDDRGK